MNIKLLVSLVLAFFCFIFIFQNASTVQVNFLFWSIEVSRVLLMVIMLGAGIVIGALLGSYLRYRSRRPVPQQGRPVNKDSLKTDKFM